EGAAWLQMPENTKRFTSRFGLESVIRARYYTCLFRNVPTYFHPDSDRDLRTLEHDNEWNEHEIVAAHWIKPVNKRRPGQQRAHLIVKFSSPQRANSAIMRGVSLLGAHVMVERLAKEARRCLKCQRLEPGHLAQNCDLIIDVCGTCAQDHKTSDCTQPMQKHRCVNCNENGHPSWSRTCPAFVEATRKIQGANKLEQYRFFP
ncbi:hypothetical protein DAEQUDRAFT_636968, partial [Daedalea quercina L-15889]